MLNVLLEALVQTGAKGIQLHLRPSDNGKINAIVMMERGNGEVKNEKLKSALAQPLVLECESGEVETLLPKELGDFIESYTPSLALSNIESVKKGHTAGQASANKAESKPNAKTAKSTAKPEATSSAKDEVAEDEDPDLF